jgi:hypothetical protein
MLKTHRQMKLPPEEELFLRQWIDDEAHYQDGQGAAKGAADRTGTSSPQLHI